MSDEKPVMLITGAGSGLGQGLALAFGPQGFLVAAADLNAVAAEETARRVRAAGGEALALDMDVSSEESVRRGLEALPEGRVDVLVNNAGLQYVAPTEEFPPEKWRQLVDVMLVGPFLLVHGVLPGMKRRGRGRIVNIGSVHSLVASPFKTAYIAAKHGLLGLSKSVALEIVDSDITINTLCPSYIHTPLVDMQIKDQARVHGVPEREVIEKIMLQPMPKKTFISIEELAGTISFLLSPAARNITGQTIVIDGGWTAR